MGTRIVVGLDGSDHARRALAFAIEEARRRGDAVIEAVHAYTIPMAATGMELGVLPPLPRTELDEAARAELDTCLGHLPSDVHVERVVVAGSAARALVEASDGAALVVVGSRGRGGFRSLLLGSTSHQVVSHAHCPVVVVPHGDRATAG